MPDLAYVAASALPLSELMEAFNQAFAGYLVPMRHSEETLGAMVRANDVRLDASLVARDAGGSLIGVGLLGVRGDRGWIGGMAVAPQFRGAGYGAALLAELIARARRLGLATVQLEVLDENTPAQRLYARHGFAVVRPLAVYNGPLAPFPGENAPEAAALAAAQLPVAAALDHFDATHAVAAPWQRERPSLGNMARSLTAYALVEGVRVRAYLLAMPTGAGFGVMDFGSYGVMPEQQSRDGATLLAHLTAGTPGAPIRAINVPPGDPLGAALDACACPVTVGQREMLLRLD